MRVTIELSPVVWWQLAKVAYAAWRFRRIEANGGMSYKDSDLVYAATARCLCGAGMAYPRGCGGFHHWDCSDILTGKAIPSGQLGSVKHEGQLPFVFYEIKSENNRSANGATTRHRTIKAPIAASYE